MSELDRAVEHPPAWDVLREESDLAGLSRRTVRGYDLLAHSIAVVCPSASALGLAVVLPWIVGPGAWVSVLLGFSLAYLIALCFSQFGSRLACAGSLYTYGAISLGPLIGFIVAASMVLGYASLVSFGLTRGANRIGESAASLTQSDATSLPLEYVAVAVAAVACIAVIMRGVHVSTRIAFFSEAITLSVLAVLIVVAAIRHGVPSASAFSLEGADPRQILVGAAIVMTVTVGFESAAALGVEAERPFKSVPQSMTRTVVLSGILFTLAMLVNPGGGSAGGSPGQRWISATADTHLADAFLQLIVGLSFLTLGLCAWTALTRIVFSLARERVLPGRLGRAHAHWQTPQTALLATLPLVMLPSIVSLLAGENIGWTTQKLLGGATVVLFIAYGLVCLAVPVFLRSIDELTAPVLLQSSVAVVGITVVGVVDVHDDVGNGQFLDLWLVAAALVIGIVWFLALRLLRPHAVARLGAHDETVTSDVLGQGRSDRE
ncbi:MAG: APC family permease [Aeromicrobium sp.]